MQVREAIKLEQTGIAPLQAAERINEIDIVRGVAYSEF